MQTTFPLKEKTHKQKYDLYIPTFVYVGNAAGPINPEAQQ